MSMNKKNMRRVVTASITSALAISLASCQAARDNTGKINTSAIYASASDDYKVTYGDLWNELKWDSASVLENQISNVVLNKYINQISIVLNKNASDLDDSDKKTLGYDKDNAYSDEDYNELKAKYEKRIVDYVVQDIYNFTYATDDYWDNFDSLSKTDIDLLEAKYVDEIYQEYLVDSVADSSSASGASKILDLIKNADYKNYEAKASDYLKIAKGLSQVYYPIYAKELLAYSALEDDIADALKDDKDEDDNKWGYYTTSSYVDKFKDTYTNNFDLSAIVINFSDESEMNETLRAFGLKIYNSKLYFIYDSYNTEKTATPGNMTYEEYIDYYDNFESSSLNNSRDKDGNQMSTVVSSEAVLEIYIQIYNYVYGGYKTKLKSVNIDATAYTDLSSLRKLTDAILKKYASADQAGTTVEKMLEDTITSLKNNNESQTYFTASEIDKKYGGTFKTTMYETLKNGDTSKCYTTSGQSTTLGTTLAYKFDEYINVVEKEEVTDNVLVAFAKWYRDNNPSSLDMTNLIQNPTSYLTDYSVSSDEVIDLQGDILELLKKDDITSTAITNYLTTELDKVKVKIYNEAAEIKYSSENTKYSKAVKKNKNSNVLATIKYSGTTWNLNIKADEKDKKSILIPGTDEAFGVFDYLETKEGATTAVNLIATQIIKTTDVYKDTNKDRKTYEKYVENMLLNFSNNGYSSSGYSSEIGKYNFMMLYFHTADIDQIVDNYYRVQAASSKLLTDFSSDVLINWIKKYVDLAEENNFALSGTRLVVYMDIDDDGNPDDIADWQNLLVKDYDATSVFVTDIDENITFGEVAKLLVCDVYNKISASTDSHTTKASSLVTEINDTAKVEYNLNPISAENTWAKYRHLGLAVKTEDFEVKNSSLDVDFTLKQRLYDYARGYSLDENGNKTKTYAYYFNDTYPTCYIEPINIQTAYSKDDSTIIETKDGYNLIMVTSGTPNASAKWTEEDHEEGLLEDIILMYNDEVVKIDNIYNDSDELNFNQIKLYVLDYAVNSASKLSPSSLSTALTTFLQPTVTRFTNSETNRIIVLNYIANKTNNQSTNLNDVVTFTLEKYNGNDGAFKNLIVMNERIADEYIDLYNDTTGTSSLYTYTDENGNEVTWWQSIINYLEAIKEAK